MKREKPSILVLEPNMLQRDLIKMALMRNKMTPIICQDPKDLRQLLLEYLPDALLIDTYLPGQNGLDLVEELNADVLLRNTKVFFISAMGYPEIVQKAVKAGASGFLVKPLDPDLMVNRIRSSFGKASHFAM